MKKQHLLITLLLALTLTSFCSEEWSPLQFREHPRSPEDHVENFLCRLNYNLTHSSEKPGTHEWVYMTVRWALKNEIPFPKGWRCQKYEKDLAYLLFIPSDQHRMNYLEGQLRKITAKLSAMGGPERNQCTSKFSIFLVLEEFLKNKDKAMKNLHRQQHTALIAQARLFQKSKLDKASQTESTLYLPAAQERPNQTDSECCIL